MKLANFEHSSKLLLKTLLFCLPLISYICFVIITLTLMSILTLSSEYIYFDNYQVMSDLPACSATLLLSR